MERPFFAQSNASEINSSLHLPQIPSRHSAPDQLNTPPPFHEAYLLHGGNNMSPDVAKATLPVCLGHTDLRKELEELLKVGVESHPGHGLLALESLHDVGRRCHCSKR